MGLGRLALAVLAGGAFIAGCGSSTTPFSPRATAAAGNEKVSRDAWQGSLLYVGGDQETYIFRYPGGRLVGKIETGSFGMCSDAQGNVYLTHVGTVERYAHGGTTPVTTLNVPGTAFSCAVDPVTGNLAVVVYCLSGCGDSVSVYSQAAEAPPKTYHDSHLRSMLYCGFDPAGNLYVDGYDSDGNFNLAKLAAGATSFKNFSFGQNIPAAAQVQWDGTYITVETRFQPQIYRLKATRGRGKIVGSTQLPGSGSRASQSWIQGDAIILPTGPQNKRPKLVLVWKYPRGGRITHAIKGFIPRHRMIDGLTVSVAPDR